MQRFDLKLALYKNTKLGNLAAYLVEGKKFLSSRFSKRRLMVKKNFADVGKIGLQRIYAKRRN
jgi:hypothetical protein